MGITLIALIITIILLLILAGITLHFTLGENGILRNAEIAGNKYKQAEENETNTLEIAEYLINSRNKTQEKREFNINITYIGTSQITIQVDEASIGKPVEKYIYAVGENIKEDTKPNITIENLPHNTNYKVTVEAVIDENTHLKTTEQIKTKDRKYIIKEGELQDNIELFKENIESVEKENNYLKVVTKQVTKRAFLNFEYDITNYKRIGIDAEVQIKTGDCGVGAKIYNPNGLKMENINWQGAYENGGVDCVIDVDICSPEKFSKDREIYITNNFNLQGENIIVVLSKNATSSSTYVTMNIYNLWMEE